MIILKRFFVIGLSLFLLSIVPLVANTNVFEVQVELMIIETSVKPIKNGELKRFEIKFQTEKWIDHREKIELPKSSKERALDIKFPQVVIDDVIVYLNDESSTTEGLYTFNETIISARPMSLIPQLTPG